MYFLAVGLTIYQPLVEETNRANQRTEDRSRGPLIGRGVLAVLGVGRLWLRAGGGTPRCEGWSSIQDNKVL